MRFEKIAVTGGNGALGQFVARDLGQDALVTCLDLKAGPKGVRSRFADVTSLTQLMEAMSGHDAVVHLAALLTIDHSEEQILTVNTVGTWNVLEAALRLGIRRVVLLSSECSSGIITIRHHSRAVPRYLPIDEAHPLEPAEAYGLSKQIGEVCAQSYAHRGLEVIALRPTLILMPWMRDYVEGVQGKEDPDLWSYVEASDVVQGIRRALTIKHRGFNAFYLSAEDTLSSEPTLDFLKRAYGVLPEIRKPDLFRSNPRAAMWDLEHSRRVLGFEPQSDWRRLLEAGSTRLTGTAGQRAG